MTCLQEPAGKTLVGKPKEVIKIQLDLNDYKDDNIDFYKLPVEVQNDLKTSYKTTSIDFNLKKIKNNKGENNKDENNKGEIYKYEVDNKNSDILENDKFIINKFNIISPDIDVVKIKEKDKKNICLNSMVIILYILKI